MEAAIRVKEFLKTQIKKGIISKDDLLKLKPGHLVKMAILKDIDQKVISETLQEIQFKLNPDLITNDIHELFDKHYNPLADQINAIMKS